MALKKGNLIFRKSLLADLFYLVDHCDEDGGVWARKMDGIGLERLPPEEVVLLADEQERLFPVDLMAAVEEQRKVMVSPQRGGKKGGMRKGAIDKLLRGLPKQGLDELIEKMAEFGIEASEGGGGEKE